MKRRPGLVTATRWNTAELSSYRAWQPAGGSAELCWGLQDPRGLAMLDRASAILSELTDGYSVPSSYISTSGGRVGQERGSVMREMTCTVLVAMQADLI
jgi:hypothetical protein